MRVAVISDVHSNLQALEAVLEHAGREGIDELWCLGDIVGYGGKPSECLALVRERTAICLGGNHDLVVSGVLDIDQFTSDAGVAARWTRSVLTPDELEVLAVLSPKGERAGVSLFHGSIRDPDLGVRADGRRRRRVAAHADDRPRARRPQPRAARARARRGRARGRQGRARSGGARSTASSCSIPGSVGQPRDRDPRAAWLLLDTEAGSARFMRSEYAIEGAQADIRAAGLPARLADRLSRGL